MGLTRERVIKDIENLEDATKVEETVKTGYCDTIADNLSLWIAVEEDIGDSYMRLSEKLDPKAGRKLEDLANKSNDTVKVLQRLLKSFEALGQERAARISALDEMRVS